MKAEIKDETKFLNDEIEVLKKDKTGAYTDALKTDHKLETERIVKKQKENEESFKKLHGKCEAVNDENSGPEGCAKALGCAWISDSPCWYYKV